MDKDPGPDDDPDPRSKNRPERNKISNKVYLENIKLVNVFK